jgi:hypothetical protein
VTGYLAKGLGLTALLSISTVVRTQHSGLSRKKPALLATGNQQLAKNACWNYAGEGGRQREDRRVAHPQKDAGVNADEIRQKPRQLHLPESKA